MYYAAPGRQVEDLAGRSSNDNNGTGTGTGADADADADALHVVREQIEFAKWAAKQVSDLRKLGFQVADKSVARVLVELRNLKAFHAGLIVVGTLCYMAWFNELDAKASPCARRTSTWSGASASISTPLLDFWRRCRQGKLPFKTVPGVPSHAPPTSVKLPGPDLFSSGPGIGATIAIPELRWHARAVPHYGYLLSGARQADLLAGGQCVPIRLPAPERLVWHKLYSSVSCSTRTDYEPRMRPLFLTSTDVQRSPVRCTGLQPQ